MVAISLVWPEVLALAFLLVVCSRSIVSSTPSVSSTTTSPNDVSLEPCFLESLKSVVCLDGNLASISLPLRNLAANTTSTLNSVTITNSTISELFGEGLFVNIALVKLFVTYSGVTAITTDVLAPLNSSLNTLSLEGNDLEKLPSAAIDQLSNLTSLNLAANRLSALPTAAFAKLSNLTELNLAGNRIKSLSSGGVFSSSAASLERLSLSSNQLGPKLERGLFKHLKKVKYLDLSNNKLTTLDRSDFTELSLLLSLNLSGNGFEKIPQSIFSRNSQLVTLNLSGNKLSEIDAYMLRGVRFLRELFVRGNKIKDVARRAFGTNTRLRKLDLSKNELSHVPHEMFSNLQWLDALDLKQNRINNISSGAFQKMYKVDIDLSFNELQRIEREAFLDVANITRLNLSHNNLTGLVKETFGENTDVVELLLQYNAIANTSLIPIANLTGLKLLNVSHNQLTDINRRSFTQNKLYELEKLDLSYNAIRDLSGSVFERFWALRYLDLSHNSLKKLGFGAFGNMPTLLELNIDNNELEEMGAGGITGLISLKTLFARRNRLKKMIRVPVALNVVHLEANRIEELQVGAFPAINSLLELYLDNNSLSRVETEAFRGVLTLRVLSLANNNFSELSDLSGALRELTSLQHLNLSGNRIRQIESRAFGNLPVVFGLRLDNNSITEISPFAFEGLLQLVSLNISGNELTNKGLSVESFRGMASLQSLDLSQNRITRLENKTHSLLEALLSLRNLSLSGNRLPFLTAKSFPSSPWIPYKLECLDLSHNVIESINSAVGLESIREISFAHNSIRKIEPSVFANMSALEAIDLSSNRLRTFENGTFGQASVSSTGKSLARSQGAFVNLTSVKLSNNRLEELHAPLRELVSLAPRLELLDISANKLASLPSELALLASRHVQINVTELTNEERSMT